MNIVRVYFGLKTGIQFSEFELAKAFYINVKLTYFFYDLPQTQDDGRDVGAFLLACYAVMLITMFAAE